MLILDILNTYHEHFQIYHFYGELRADIFREVCFSVLYV